MKRYTDKNGKIIKNGDIINIHQTVNGCNLFIVVLHEGNYTAAYFTENFLLNPIRHYEYDLDELFEVNTDDSEKWLEVIGNIGLISSLKIATPQSNDKPWFPKEEDSTIDFGRNESKQVEYVSISKEEVEQNIKLLEQNKLDVTEKAKKETSFEMKELYYDKIYRIEGKIETLKWLIENRTEKKLVESLIP